MHKLGLIGEKLDYSFSKSYFESKFKQEKIEGWSYELFELANIHLLPQLLAQSSLVGINVTIPYKQAVLKYLHAIDPVAATIGAVNTIAISDAGLLKGYNTDAIGFRESLLYLLGDSDIKDIKALVLGTGGASKAITYVLNLLGIAFKVVSRSADKGVTYTSLHKSTVEAHRLLVNCTPLGTHPNLSECPLLPYEGITNQHFLYDLVYNPQKSLFLQRGEAQGAAILNGQHMLVSQAEAAWRIWNQIKYR